MGQQLIQKFISDATRHGIGIFMCSGHDFLPIFIDDIKSEKQINQLFEFILDENASEKFSH